MKNSEGQAQQTHILIKFPMVMLASGSKPKIRRTRIVSVCRQCHSKPWLRGIFVANAFGRNPIWPPKGRKLKRCLLSKVSEARSLVILVLHLPLDNYSPKMACVSLRFLFKAIQKGHCLKNKHPYNHIESWQVQEMHAVCQKCV